MIAQSVRHNCVSVHFWLWFYIVAVVCFDGSYSVVSAQEKTGTSISSDSTGKSPVWQPSPTGAMVRALVFPGWGQWYNHKKLKAALVFAVESSIIATAIYWQNQMEQAPTYGERAFDLDNRNLAFWYLGGAMLLSMADAFIDAHLAGFDVSPDLSLSQRQPAVGFTVRYWF